MWWVFGAYVWCFIVWVFSIINRACSTCFFQAIFYMTKTHIMKELKSVLCICQKFLYGKYFAWKAQKWQKNIVCVKWISWHSYFGRFFSVPCKKMRVKFNDNSIVVVALWSLNLAVGKPKSTFGIWIKRSLPDCTNKVTWHKINAIVCWNLISICFCVCECVYLCLDRTSLPNVLVDIYSHESTC